MQTNKKFSILDLVEDGLISRDGKVLTKEEAQSMIDKGNAAVANATDYEEMVTYLILTTNDDEHDGIAFSLSTKGLYIGQINGEHTFVNNTYKVCINCDMTVVQIHYMDEVRYNQELLNIGKKLIISGTDYKTLAGLDNSAILEGFLLVVEGGEEGMKQQALFKSFEFDEESGDLIPIVKSEEEKLFVDSIIMNADSYILYRPNINLNYEYRPGS